MRSSRHFTSPYSRHVKRIISSHPNHILYQLEHDRRTNTSHPCQLMHRGRLHNLLVKRIPHRIIRLTSHRVRLCTFTPFLMTFSSTGCQLRTNDGRNPRLISSIHIIFKVMFTSFQVTSSRMQTTRVNSRVNKSITNRHSLQNS